MGFYIRKGFNFGPLRLNLARSGLGASFGVKGARIGVGPRGSYVHVGRGGLYYRQSLGVPESRRAPSRPLTSNVEVLPEVESGDVSQMVDASSAALLAELNRVHRRWELFPPLLVGILVLIGFLSFMAWNSPGVMRWSVPEHSRIQVPIAEVLRERLAVVGPSLGIPLWLWWQGAAVLVLALSVLLLLWARNRDVTRGTVILRYDLEPEANEEYSRLKDAFSGFAYAGAVWHVNAQGGTRDWKRQAGANTLVDRQSIRPRLSQPRRVECNIAVPTLPAGRQMLYFFPDRVLVYDKEGVGAVAYRDLQVRANTVNFRESNDVPKDAQVISSTWMYVNRDGGPDRRFRNNHQIPIVEYGELRLRSGSGLDELFQCSKSAAAGQLAEVLELTRFGGGFTAFGIIPGIALASHTPWATGSRGRNDGGAG